MPILVPEVAEVRFFYEYDAGGKVEENVLHWKRAGGWDSTTIQQLATAASDGFSADLADQMPTEASMVKVETRDLSEEFGVTGVDTTVFGGTSENEFASPNNSVLVKFICGTSGPPRQGGAFWPFVREGDVSETGVVNATFGGNLATYFHDLNTYVNNNTSGSPDQVVTSLYSKGAWIAAHPGATEAEILAAKPWPREEGVSSLVTNWTYRTIVASQRGRRVRPA